MDAQTTGTYRATTVLRRLARPTDGPHMGILASVPPALT